MREVVDGLWQIPLVPREAVNAYLVGDVLVDAGTPGVGKKLPGRLADHTVSAHAITHAHQDHVGGAKAVCDALGIDLWAPAGDVADAERGKQVTPEGTWATRLLERAPGWPAHPVARRLAEGDEVGGFTVIDTPGHSPGHVSFWRESDRALVVGDVFFNIHRGPGSQPRVDAPPGRAGPGGGGLRPRPPLFEAGPKLKAFAGSL